MRRRSDLRMGPSGHRDRSSAQGQVDSRGHWGCGRPRLRDSPVSGFHEILLSGFPEAPNRPGNDLVGQPSRDAADPRAANLETMVTGFPGTPKALFRGCTIRRKPARRKPRKIEIPKSSKRGTPEPGENENRKAGKRGFGVPCPREGGRTWNPESGQCGGRPARTSSADTGLDPPRKPEVPVSCNHESPVSVFHETMLAGFPECPKQTRKRPRGPAEPGRGEPACRKPRNHGCGFSRNPETTKPRKRTRLARRWAPDPGKLRTGMGRAR
jgi:hypothetical protein